MFLQVDAYPGPRLSAEEDVCPPPESYFRDLKDFSLEHVVLDPFSWGLWVEGSLCRCFRDLSDSFVEHEI